MASRWTIEPFVGLGELEFGMSRTETRRLLNTDVVSFRKTPSEIQLTDDYSGIGFHLYFDENDNLEFIETFTPCPVEYEGMRFLGIPLEQVLAEANSRGMAYEQLLSQEACFFKNLGFVLYVPEVIVEAVSIYKKGYHG